MIQLLRAYPPMGAARQLDRRRRAHREGEGAAGDRLRADAIAEIGEIRCALSTAARAMRAASLCLDTWERAGCRARFDDRDPCRAEPGC